MKILIATDHYPPFIGGAHRQAQLIAQGMSGRGHEVAVTTPWHGGLPTVESAGGVEVHRLKQVRTVVSALVRDQAQRHQPPFPDPVTIWQLRRLIRSFEPDLIHAYGWLAFSVAVALGRKKVPLLVSARDYGYFCATRTLVRKGEPCSGPAPLKCASCASEYYGPTKGLVATASVYACKPMLARRMTGLHSVSDFVSDVTGRYLFGPRGTPPTMVQTTIPSFQTIEPAAPLEEREGIEPYLEQLPDRPYILYVGAFRRVKGLEVLFDAYRRLDSPPPLVLMGTFERDTPENFPDGAVVLTDVPHAGVMAAWEGAMFGVMPSLWPEPFGATVAEAMNRSTAVIGTQPGGHVDMLGEESDLLVPAGDVGALARAMKLLLGDPDLRDRRAKEASERAHKFAASAVLPRFEQTYLEVVAAGPR